MVKTFLFTDIEGSTRLWESDPERMREAIARHEAITREAIEHHRGLVVKMAGDGAYAAFDNPLDGVRAAVRLQRALADPQATGGLRLPLRCGLHIGIDADQESDFVGRSVNRTARIMRIAHGGQVLLSEALAALVVDGLPEGLTLRDLGSVRLRDLARPERVYQVLHPELQAEFPPVHSLETIPNNLPVQVTSFIGREAELGDIGKLLEEARLLTLIGPGGIGKTRLTLHAAAHAMDAHPDGVWFVPLAPLTDARLVPQAIAAALGILVGTEGPAAEALLKFVQDRRLLIILDNCEHLLSACADIAAQMIQSGSRVRILASSREALRVAGETTYPVRPLSTPGSSEALSAATLIGYEAARLFVERVTAVRPDFQVTDQSARAVADICDRLDGIPLAIELAAGRARALSVEGIAERLIDRFRLLTRGDQTALPRQQTLRASIDWSHELLSGPERALLRRLAVFAGGWTLQAAESVCADGSTVHGLDVLDLLTNLVEKSMVVVEADGERYRLLETVRQYGQERLKESGEEEATANRHLAYFLALAEQSEERVDQPRPKPWFSRLDPEWGNLLAAFEGCSRTPEAVKTGLRLVYAVRPWIVARGLLAPGYRITVDLLNSAAAQQRDLVRCRALWTASELSFLTGRYADAREHVQESLAIAREIDDPLRVAEALRGLGYVCLAHGELATARKHFEAALDLARKLGGKSQLAAALNGLGEAHRTEGNLDRARPLYEEAVALDRELRDRRRLAIHLCNLAGVLLASGAGSSTQAVLSEALEIAEEIGSKQAGLAVLGYCAGLSALRQEWLPAARLYGAAQLQLEKMDYRREPMEENFVRPLIAKVRQALGEADFASAEAVGRTLSYQQAVTQARAWLGVIGGEMPERASPDDYLKDYHRRRPGTTSKIFGQLPLDVDGRRFESSYHYLADQIPRTDAPLRVLDLACGDGFLLALLAQRGQRGLELYGLDFSAAELTAARSRLGHEATLLHADARQLPVASASVDIVVTHLALMLMDQVDKVLREINRVLRPNGRLHAIVARPRTGRDRDAVHPLVEAALKKMPDPEAVPWVDPRMMSAQGISELLSDGFQNLSSCDLECRSMLDPGAYWQNLEATYTVDILPAQLQSELKANVLSAIAPICGPDGKVATTFALRYFTASTGTAFDPRRLSPTV